MTNGSIDIDDTHGDVSGVIKDLFKNSYTFNISSYHLCRLQLKQCRYRFVFSADGIPHRVAKMLYL